MYYDEKRRKGRANYNGNANVYHYNHSNYDACYDGITIGGQGNKNSLPFFFYPLCYECFKASCKTC